MTRRMLSRDQARAFYDDFGSRQDQQGWYEDAALAELLDRSELDQAHSVLELGCGTGRLAARILEERLPADARYLGIDLSPTMQALAARRLAAFGDRARVAPAEVGTLPARAGGWDRLISTYVLDLLPEDEARRLLAQAHEILAPEGRLCLAGITHGTTLPSRLVMGGWDLVHRLRPALVGGCRPTALDTLLAEGAWTVLYDGAVLRWGVASQVLVATPRSP